MFIRSIFELFMLKILINQKNYIHFPINCKHFLQNIPYKQIYFYYINFQLFIVSSNYDISKTKVVLF